MKNSSRNFPEYKNHSRVLMIQGTMSSAGKSLLTAALCRVFTQDGFRVSPFKSQNMALNSFVTSDGKEMGRAQVMQAEACGVKPLVEMNPILLKPTTDSGSQVIVNGEIYGNMSALDYFSFKKNLIFDIEKAFQKLEQTSDIVVVEGAGSPAEINLRENDIVNMGLAEILDSPVILVADIDRGGVFAQLLGTVELLSESERARVKGFVINKFRGDKTLLESGIKYIEEKIKIPCVGVFPYLKVSLDDEDSLTNRFEKNDFDLINLGVVRLPRISNFSDFSVFENLPGVAVHYITNAKDVQKMDMIFLPGSKNTIGDLKWLKSRGFDSAIKMFAGENPVFGICGGYQMLGVSVSDPENVEEGGTTEGLGLLDAKTVLKSQKTRTQTKGRIKIDSSTVSTDSKCSLNNGASFFDFLPGLNFSGYEIHMGETQVGEKSQKLVSGGKTLGAVSKNVTGTYVHGFFDEGNLAELLVQKLAGRKGISAQELVSNSSSFSNFDFQKFKQTQYDILADAVRKNLDIKKIYAMMRESKV